MECAPVIVSLSFLVGDFIYLGWRIIAGIGSVCKRVNKNLMKSSTSFQSKNFECSNRKIVFRAIFLWSLNLRNLKWTWNLTVFELQRSNFARMNKEASVTGVPRQKKRKTALFVQKKINTQRRVKNNARMIGPRWRYATDERFAAKKKCRQTFVESINRCMQYTLHFYAILGILAVTFNRRGWGEGYSPIDNYN